jgi:chaperonin cofactor prefoldin
LIDLKSHHGTHVLKPGETVSTALAPERPFPVGSGYTITFGKSVYKDNQRVRPVTAHIQILFETQTPPVYDRSFGATSNAGADGQRGSSGRYGMHGNLLSSPSTSPSSSDDSDIEEITPPSPHHDDEAAPDSHNAQQTGNMSQPCITNVPRASGSGSGSYRLSSLYAQIREFRQLLPPVPAASSGPAAQLPSDFDLPLVYHNPSPLLELDSSSLQPSPDPGPHTPSDKSYDSPRPDSIGLDDEYCDENDYDIQSVDAVQDCSYPSSSRDHSPDAPDTDVFSFLYAIAEPASENRNAQEPLSLLSSTGAVLSQTRAVSPASSGVPAQPDFEAQVPRPLSLMPYCPNNVVQIVDILTVISPPADPADPAPPVTDAPQVQLSALANLQGNIEQLQAQVEKLSSSIPTIESHLLGMRDHAERLNALSEQLDRSAGNVSVADDALWNELVERVATLEEKVRSINSSPFHAVANTEMEAEVDTAVSGLHARVEALETQAKATTVSSQDVAADASLLTTRSDLDASMSALDNLVSGMSSVF